MSKYDNLSFDIASRSPQKYGHYQCFGTRRVRRSSLRKLFSVIVIAAFILLAFASPAFAADAASGAKIFSANCAACHQGGRNVVIAAKTLQKEALQKYNMNSIEAIVTQVQNGKNAMPAFKGRLNDEQIEDVAAYVLEKSEKGWM